MALSVFIQNSKRLPVLSCTISKLLTPQLKSTPLIITPIAVKNYTAFNRQNVGVKKYNNVAVTQCRSAGGISHSVIWIIEKLVSVALLGIIPGCIAIGGLTCDNILAVAVGLHMHWGVEGVFCDYVRPALCGNVIPVITHIFVCFMSVFTLAGMLYFNYNDIGLTCALKRFWAIKTQPEE